MGMINEIMSWFGYVRKEDYEKLKKDLTKSIKDVGVYKLFETLIEEDSLDAYYIECESDKCYKIEFGLLCDTYKTYLLKTIPYDDDKEFARIQAEELCELINNV